jgi:hypothetical protein
MRERGPPEPEIITDISKTYIDPSADSCYLHK